MLPLHKRGLVLGKFLPLHKGHEYLISFASRYVTDLTVVVDNVADQEIPVAIRVGWVKALFPHARVVGLEVPTPQNPHEHPDFWNFWKQTLEYAAGGPVDYIFASEQYGSPLAHTMRATFIPCDTARQIIPISGTIIRGNPLSFWKHLPQVVRKYFTKKICLVGPESTGKSTMCNLIATQLDGQYVPEYAKGYITIYPKLNLSDMTLIANGQIATETTALDLALRPLMLCDTDVLTTSIWSQVLFNAIPTDFPTQVPAYDITILLEPTTPWVDDIHRKVLPNASSTELRWDFFRRNEEALIAAKRKYVIIGGTYTERMQSVTEIARNFLTTPNYCPLTQK